MLYARSKKRHPYIFFFNRRAPRRQDNITHKKRKKLICLAGIHPSSKGGTIE
jgi:hypothetical protein